GQLDSRRRHDHRVPLCVRRRRRADGGCLALHHPDGRAAAGRPVDAAHRDGGVVQFACASLVSISSRSSVKSIGLVSSPEAPFSNALRLVSGSPYAVIMITGTSGRIALTLGSISSPVMPGMLMSERIRISDCSMVE